MADPDDLTPPGSVLARADALMQRRRQGGDLDDLPVLTEVVASDDIPLLEDAVAPEAAAGDVDPAVLASLADELADRVRARLAAEIPSLVEAAIAAHLATLSEDLRLGVLESAGDAIRDFIAERERLARPPRR